MNGFGSGTVTPEPASAKYSLEMSYYVNRLESLAESSDVRWNRTNQSACPVAITIRSAVSGDAEGIARTFLESAACHARLDPERYFAPAIETISERYREGRQHPRDARGDAITLVAELSGEIAGFIDARVERSPDPMHREMTYCHMAEIAGGSH